VLTSKSFDTWLNNLNTYKNLISEYEMSPSQLKEQIILNIFNIAVGKKFDQIQYGRYCDQLKSVPDYYYKGSHRIFYTHTTPEQEQYYMSILDTMKNRSDICKSLNKKYVYTKTADRINAKNRISGKTTRVQDAFSPAIEFYPYNRIDIIIKLDLSILAELNYNEYIDLSNVYDEQIHLKYLSATRVSCSDEDSEVYKTVLNNIINHNLTFNFKNVAVNYQLIRAITDNSRLMQDTELKKLFNITKSDLRL
jgi:hypothetical protein